MKATQPTILASSQPIRSLDDWRHLVSHGIGDEFWARGQHAYEYARAWMDPRGRPRVPDELLALLRSRAETADTRITTVWPEPPARRGSLSHESGSADLYAVGEGTEGRVALGIDVRADESFGRSVRQVLAAAEKPHARDKMGRVSRSVTQLLSSHFGDTLTRQLSLGDIPLQLLTRIAGTLAFARDHDATLAVFVVHEFVTDETQDEKHLRNLCDFNRLVERLASGRRIGVRWGELIGPFDRRRGARLADGSRPALFIGKIRRVLRSPDRLGAIGGEYHTLVVEKHGVPPGQDWRSRFDRIEPYGGGSSGAVFLAENGDGVYVVTSECLFADMLEPDEPTEFVYRFATKLAREVWCAERFGGLVRVRE